HTHRPSPPLHSFPTRRSSDLFRHHGQRAPRPRQQLAEIVAGDVLHHPAPGLETVAEAGHRMRAEQMIARAAGLDATGTGEPRAEDRKSTRLNSSHDQISYAVF